jgi:hypothetical protein
VGHNRLSPKARAVLASIAAQQANMAFWEVHPGTKRLAEEAGCSMRHVPRVIRDLVALQLLELVEVGGGWVPEKGCGRAHVWRVTPKGWAFIAGTDGVTAEETWTWSGSPAAAVVTPPTDIQSMRPDPSSEKEGVEVKGGVGGLRPPVEGGTVEKSASRRRHAPPRSTPAFNAAIAQTMPPERLAAQRERHARPWERILYAMGLKPDTTTSQPRNAPPAAPMESQGWLRHCTPEQARAALERERDDVRKAIEEDRQQWFASIGRPLPG